MVEKIFIIGCGKLGSALAMALANTPHQVRFCYDSNLERARALSRALPGCQAVDSIDQAVAGTTLVLVAVTDTAIAQVGALLRESSFCVPACLWAHTSGLWPASLLHDRPEVQRGSFHPVMLYPKGGAARFENVPITLEGDGAAISRLHRLAGDLKATPMVIETDKKALYHTACTMASNLCAGLFAATESVAQLIRPGEGLNWLLPIIRATVDEVVKRGAAATLTGPVRRGDIETVSMQMDALQDAAPSLLPVYSILSQFLVDLSQQQGLSADRVEALRTLLKDGCSQ